MAQQYEILELVVGAYAPETLPLERLALYLQQFAALLGEQASVRILQVAPGSTRLQAAVAHEAVPKVRARVLDVRDEGGDPEVAKAYRQLDCLLREDNTDGELRPVGAQETGGRLLYFPGIRGQRDEEYGPFWQPSHVTGVPISVGGHKALVNVNLEDGGRALYCEATREVALRIAPLLFRHHIRAHGTGRYLRDADGHWQMQKFRITEFEILDTAPLDEIVEHLRSITRKTGLEQDIIARLAELREA